MYDLYLGDCLKILDELIKKQIKVDAIITDLPYGTTKLKWDIVVPFEPMWEKIKKIRKETAPIILFGDEPFSSRLRLSNINEYRYDMYWKKNKAVNFFSAYKQTLKTIETISFFYKKQCTYNPIMEKSLIKKHIVKNVTYTKHSGIIKSSEKLTIGNSEKYDIEYNLPNRIIEIPVKYFKNNHPTEKPVELLEYLIFMFSNENDIILDFTMGSGSCGVASRNMGRRFIGIEKQKKYFEIAKKRIEKARNLFW